MSDRIEREKVIRIISENIFRISQSLNVVLDGLVKMLENTEISTSYEKQLEILNEIEQTINYQETLEKELPITKVDEEFYQILTTYLQASRNTFAGFRLILEYLRDDDRPPEIIREATDKLFESSQTMADIVNEILKDE